MGTLTRTLLQNIEVLSAGQDFKKDAEGKPVVVQVINLLVTPEQAEQFSLAAARRRFNWCCAIRWTANRREDAGDALLHVQILWRRPRSAMPERAGRRRAGRVRARTARAAAGRRDGAAAPKRKSRS